MADNILNSPKHPPEYVLKLSPNLNHKGDFQKLGGRHSKLDLGIHSTPYK